MVRNVAQAAPEMISAMYGAAEAAKETGSAAGQVLTAAFELTHHAEPLGRAMTQFLATVRAA